MIFSSVQNLIRSRLAIKSSLLVVLFFVIISVTLSSFFFKYQEQHLDAELKKRANTLAGSLAYNSRKIIFSPNRAPLKSFVNGVKEEPDIENAYIVDPEGRILAHSDTALIKSKLDVSLSTSLEKAGKWITGRAEGTRIVSAPVHVYVPVVDTTSILINDKPIENHFVFTNAFDNFSFYFPKFDYNSKSIIFNVSFQNYRQESRNYPMTMGMSIEGGTLLLLENFSNHGVWSNSGRYFFSHDSESADMIVRDMSTGDVYNLGINPIFGVARFTHDEKYIVTTIVNEDGQSRLFSIPVSGGKRMQLTNDEGRHWYPGCSPDGKWIIYTDNLERNLHIYNTETKKSSPVFPDLHVPVVSGAFSPDGDRICYLRNRRVENSFQESEQTDVFIADFPVDNSLPPDKRHGWQLTFNGGIKFFVDWSPKGNRITYGQKWYFGDRSDIWIVKAEKNAAPVNLTGSVDKELRTAGFAVVEVSMENLNRAISKSKYISLSLILVFTAIGILGAVLLSLSFVRPIRHLAAVTDEVSKGNLNQFVKTSRIDELGLLAESFNMMTKQLKHSIEEIETRNNELEKAYEELKTLDNTKDDFLSLVSHELRSPLGSMLLHVDMLRNHRIDDEEKKDLYYETIANQCKRLARLVNDVLDLSKIEAGRMEFILEPFSIRRILSDINSVMETWLSKKQIKFDYSGVPNNIFVMGDRDKITQVLTNIITNAIKFTPDNGSIGVTLVSDGSVATIAVSDTGIGIPETAIPKVFDRFSQLENVGHHTDGSGLGMSIAKSIVNSHDGDIWIESKPGEGTTVYITLKVTDKNSESLSSSENSAMQEPESVQNAKSSSKSRIMIVDDEISYRQAICDCVTAEGYNCIQASDGASALRLAEEHVPSLIILDVMLPNISGLEVCKSLRQNEKTRNIKIIMLSARGQARDKKDGMEAGADRYITKPFDYNELIQTINELSGGDL